MSSKFGNGAGVYTLASGIGAAETMFAASADGGPCNIYYLQNTHASKVACFRVTGGPALQFASTEKIALYPNTGLVPVSVGGNANGITKITGWGEDTSGNASSGVTALGFTGKRV